ncbi:MAG: dienelactone hydrolase family protein, partial [Bryobacteraceae bacterium]
MINMHITRRGWLAAAGFGFTARAQTVHEEIRSAANHAPLRMQFPGGSAADCRRWQQAFGAKLHQLLGPHQPPAKWETITEKTVVLDDHTRHSLLLRADGVRDLPVHLLVPRPPAQTRRPAIVALHGHGDYGYDSVAGVATTAPERAAIAGANYDFGLQLVRRGYVVAAPCLTPFGRRLGNKEAYKQQDACAVTLVRMQLLGKLPIAENLRDALWSLELLASQSNVDPARIGCVGLSLGGRMTMLTAAISPKVRVAVISGALNMLQERILGTYSCGAQV